MGPSLAASLVYDADGKLVKSTIGSTTTTFVGNYYEVSGSTVTKYYYAGSSRVAMNVNGTVTYLLSDHLGSTSITADGSGGFISELRYKAWGEVRYSNGTTATKYTYTGQFSNVDNCGLMYFNARWYDPYLNRWTQPDTIVPNIYDPQAWDRFAYALNNPIRYNDPSGHRNCEEDGYNCGADKGERDNGGDWRYRSKDGGWNDPRYSTWNTLRWGSACTACHVTHDQPGDWSIPTNGQIDPDLVQYYRSLDGVARAVHTAGFIYAGGIAAKLAASGGIPDDALVCRGGMCTAERFANGSGVITNADGTLSDVSVNSAAGKSIEDLTQNINNKQVGVSTAGDIRLAGGQISPDPLDSNPYNATISGLTAQQLEGLFTPTRPNPWLITGK